MKQALGLAILSLSLCSCDLGAGRSVNREIAGGYRLKRSPDSTEFALTIPYQTGGLIIDEIGWRKPFIIARGSGSQYWDVINTDRAQHTRVSDSDLKSDATFQSIETKTPDDAWKDLTGTPLW